jgi:hypothetical protein
MVGEPAIACDIGRSAFEDAAEGGEAEFGAPAIASEAVQDETKGVPHVDVSGTAPPSRNPAQAGGREPIGVPLLGRGCGVGIQEEATVLGHEAEQQPIGKAEEGSVIVSEAEVTAGPEAGAELRVLRLLEEPSPERFDGLPDTNSEGAESAGAGLGRMCPPAFQPAVLGAGLIADGFEAGLVAEEEQDGKVAEYLPVEHGFQVELDVGLSDEG